jgi:RimJ/RimL family protein N-acetyltransferase
MPTWRRAFCVSCSAAATGQGGNLARRHEYLLDLSTFEWRSAPAPDARLQLRAPRVEDAGALAELMIESYRGTIDYDGETLNDALREVQAYLAGERGGQPLLNESRLAFAGPQLVGACLVGVWDERQSSLINYVMTHGAWKGQGVGKRLLAAALQALRNQGHETVRAVITEDNIPSERLLSSMGFRRIGVNK